MTDPARLDDLPSLEPHFASMVQDALPRLRAGFAASSKRGQAGRPGGTLAVVVTDPAAKELLGAGPGRVAALLGSRPMVMGALGRLFAVVASAAEPRLRLDVEARGGREGAVKGALAKLRLPPAAGRLRAVLVAEGEMRVVDLDLRE